MIEISPRLHALALLDNSAEEVVPAGINLDRAAKVRRPQARQLASGFNPKRLKNRWDPPSADDRRPNVWEGVPEPFGNPYLFNGYRALAENAKPLLIYGFSFGEHDRHIMDAIAASKTPTIVVALHSGTAPDNKARIKSEVRALAARIKLPNSRSAQCSIESSDKFAVW